MHRTFTLALALLAAAAPLALSNCAGVLPVEASNPGNGNQACSNQTLQGQYAFRVSGYIYLPGKPPLSILAYRDGVAMTNFDGNGGLTQSDFIMGNGLTPENPAQPSHTAAADIDPQTGFSINETGTYQVNADCTGKAEIDMPAPLDGAGNPVTPGARISLMLVIGDGGRTLHTIVSQLLLPGGTPALANIHSDAVRVVGNNGNN